MSNPIANISIKAQVAAFGGAGRGGGTRKLAEARAAKSGKSVGAELRAVQRALKTGNAPAKQAPEVARAGAGASLRAARSISAGTVHVSYSTGKGRRYEGTRDLSNGGRGFQITGDLADARDRAADALDRGDAAGAQDILNEALLDAYGGMGGTLEIREYGSGGIDLY